MTQRIEKEKRLYKVATTIKIPVDVFIFIEAEDPRDARVMASFPSSDIKKIVLDEEDYNPYSAEQYQDVIEKTVDDEQWSADINPSVDPVKVCCLCDKPLDVYKDDDGKVTYDDGNDALPLADGRCCNDCDFGVTIARMQKLGVSK